MFQAGSFPRRSSRSGDLNLRSDPWLELWPMTWFLMPPSLGKLLSDVISERGVYTFKGKHVCEAHWPSLLVMKSIDTDRPVLSVTKATIFWHDVLILQAPHLLASRASRHQIREIPCPLASAETPSMRRFCGWKIKLLWIIPPRKTVIAANIGLFR